MSERAKNVSQRPTVDRTAISESGGDDIIFELIKVDPLDHRNTLSPPSSDNDEPTATGVQPTDDRPETQHTQEENPNAASAKVIGPCQPHDAL